MTPQFQVSYSYLLTLLTLSIVIFKCQESGDAKERLLKMKTFVLHTREELHSLPSMKKNLSYKDRTYTNLTYKTPGDNLISPETKLKE